MAITTASVSAAESATNATKSTFNSDGKMPMQMERGNEIRLN